jgi:hypothetical protein
MVRNTFVRNILAASIATMVLVSCNILTSSDNDSGTNSNPIINNNPVVNKDTTWYALRNNAWVHIDWDSLTKGMSTFEKDAITEDSVELVGLNYYRTAYLNGGIYKQVLLKSTDAGVTWNTVYTCAPTQSVGTLSGIGDTLFISVGDIQTYGSTHFQLGLLLSIGPPGSIDTIAQRRIGDEDLYSGLQVAQFSFGRVVRCQNMLYTQSFVRCFRLYTAKPFGGSQYFIMADPDASLWGGVVNIVSADNFIYYTKGNTISRVSQLSANSETVSTVPRPEIIDNPSNKQLLKFFEYKGEIIVNTVN